MPNAAVLSLVLVALVFGLAFLENAIWPGA
jgi:hypothetical protein